MEIVIKVENLGKKYIISHQQERQTTLRDVMANTAKKAVKKAMGKGEGLSKKEEFWALRNIDFEVNAGDRIGIIGKNGAGKSTLLKVLSRITEPTEGKIKIRGKISSLLEVGTGFHPELTGRENIYLNGAVLGMSRNDINRKFKEIVEFAEVDKFIDTPVKRYSSGMYVRLAFAVAANLDPEIMIIDEVLAVGDAQFQKKCLGKMEDVSKNEGRTILFVSHNMGAIISLTEKCILLDKGKIIIYDNTERVINAYLNMDASNNEDNANGNFNFINCERPKGKVKLSTSKAIFISGRAYDENNKIKTVFKEGEGFKIAVVFRIVRNVNFVELSFNLKDVLDIPVFTVLSDIFQMDLIPGEYEAEININPNYLRPGDYSINMSIYTPDLQDGIKNAMQITIEAMPILYNNPHWSIPNLGMVKLPYKWEKPKKIL